MQKTAKKLVREIVGGEPYEYYPVGRYIVIAPGVCGGRPTFKYTRDEAIPSLLRQTKQPTFVTIIRIARTEIQPGLN